MEHRFLNSINIMDQKSDICLNNKEYNMSTDSRSVQKNDIFIALKGRYSDGHNFLPQAFNNGICTAIPKKFLKVKLPTHSRTGHIHSIIKNF